MSFKEKIKDFFLLSAVENLQNLLFARIKDPDLLTDENKVEGQLLRRAETFGVAGSSLSISPMKSKLTYSECSDDVHG